MGVCSGYRCTRPYVHADMGQVAVALGYIQSVADHELGWDLEPDVPEIGITALQPLLHEEGAHLDARGLAGLQVLAQVGEGEAAVDDVLDDDHVSVGEVEIEVLHDPY